MKYYMVCKNYEDVNIEEFETWEELQNRYDKLTANRTYLDYPRGPDDDWTIISIYYGIEIELPDPAWLKEQREATKEILEYLVKKHYPNETGASNLIATARDGGDWKGIIDKE